jgi:pantoate kinase
MPRLEQEKGHRLLKSGKEKEGKDMLKSTIDRYQIVRREVYKRLGKMPTMEAYADVAREMGMTEETVRKIVRKINKWDMVPTKS